MVSLAVTRRAEALFEPKPWPSTLRVGDIALHAIGDKSLPAEVNEWRRKNRHNLARRLRKVLLARSLRIPTFYGALFLEVIRGDGERIPYGLASVAVVTDAGVNFIRDDFNAGAQDISNMKYHGFGTGSTAEAVGQTALVTELTTQYVVDNTRPTGTQTTNGTGIYRTVGTLDPDADVAITEHGIFSATSAGTMLDRSVFSAINLVGATGDTLQATYDFTMTSGG
jgi:hypothetical protein